MFVLLLRRTLLKPTRSLCCALCLVWRRSSSCSAPASLFKDRWSVFFWCRLFMFSSSSETGMHPLALLWPMLVCQRDWTWVSCWETSGGRRDRCADWDTRSTAEQQVNTPAARSQPATSWSHSTDLCERRKDRFKRCFSETVVMLFCRDEC